ncbi:MAG TPA: CoA-acylating methylmalonate-semialdehyde dehydrogenase [Verrucomicrobiae bacterium]|jgi:malonate-semialdehyde dehydrogenase (acetylating)/methylmalonate-semialdehyde dehydrogenase|nr:CoA-acylating methylmalonate-semialdehyde dehydrogenase [Verrucomicrobiae bacterium]
MQTTTTPATVGHFIGGLVSEPAPNGRFGDIYDPARGIVQKRVAFADDATVDRAVAAARAAFAVWGSLSLGKRAEVLFAFRENVRRHADEFATIVSGEHGKIVTDAAGEVARALEVIEFACSLTHQMKGELSENVSTNIDTYSLRQPVGVCAGITPFNFPMMVPIWMLAPALAAGNTFVLKPSERDPSAAMLMAKLLKESGLPDGAFNVVHGDKSAVDALLRHPDVDAISFVGSTPIARYIYATAAAHGKRVQALGGAKNHMVVMPDADIASAADALVSAGYGSAGQRCMAISACITVGDAGDALMEAVGKRIATLKIGAGHDPSNDMGPVVTPAARDRVVGYIEAGVREGATLAADGRALKVSGYENGFFVGPTLFDNVTTKMSIYTDEIFGPVLVNLRVKTLDEALQIMAANPYGNGCSIFTRSGAAARRFQSEVEVGLVGVNVPIPVPVGYYSFGGWKASLFGDLHIYGPDGFKFYTRGKVVTARWHDTNAGMSLGFPTHE